MTPILEIRKPKAREVTAQNYQGHKFFLVIGSGLKSTLSRYIVLFGWSLPHTHYISLRSQVNQTSGMLEFLTSPPLTAIKPPSHVPPTFTGSDMLTD